MKPPLSKNENIVVQEADRELLIYDLISNQAYCLNETSALVWQFSNGRNSIAEIADLMSQKLKTLVTEEVVWLALEQLKKDNLLENGKDFELEFNGLNRRQIIKKVGLASMIALPVIASVIAPNSTMAQSVRSACDVPGCIEGGVPTSIISIQPDQASCSPLGTPTPAAMECCSCEAVETSWSAGSMICEIRECA